MAELNWLLTFITETNPGRLELPARVQSPIPL